MPIYLLIVLFIAYGSSGSHNSVLGAAWPTAYQDLGVALSWGSYVNMIIAGGRIIAGLVTNRLVRRFGTHRVAILGFSLFCISLLGCASSRSYAMLCISSIPMGFGDTLLTCSLNAFTALHLSGKYVNWLNMPWSLGATLGPYIISLSLAKGGSWNQGYLILASILICMFFVFLSAVPQWKKIPDVEFGGARTKKDTQENAFKLKGMSLMLAVFFSYLAIENVSSLWASSYITVNKGLMEDIAALGATCLFLGMMVGRFVSGIIVDKLGDKNTIHLGQLFVVIGGLAMFFSTEKTMILISMFVFGMGCAPMYPCLMHYVPSVFGVENTGAAIGLLMGLGQVASLILPIVFGWIADLGGMWLFPFAQILFAVIMMAAMIYLKRRISR